MKNSCIEGFVIKMTFLLFILCFVEWFVAVLRSESIQSGFVFCLLCCTFHSFLMYVSEDVCLIIALLFLHTKRNYEEMHNSNNYKPLHRIAQY